MRISLCGTRGSTPTPGRDFRRYGGHTSCLAVTCGEATSPELLLDAGTGIREVTELLDGRPFRGTIALTLERSMSPPAFPITPRQLRGDWKIGGLQPGRRQLGGLSLLAREIPHKGGRTFGHRVSDGRSAVAYQPDHCPTHLGPGPDGLGVSPARPDRCRA